MVEPIWVTEKIVLAIHEDQLVQHGGSSGIRDENLLGAKVWLDQNTYLLMEIQAYSI